MHKTQELSGNKEIVKSGPVNQRGLVLDFSHVTVLEVKLDFRSNKSK